MKKSGILLRVTVPVVSDGGLVLGILSSQFGDAVEFAAKYGASHVTGHSLGGGLAAHVSLELGIKATTFNASGFHWINLIGYNLNKYDLITNYRSTSDILSIGIRIASGYSSPGKEIYIKNTGRHTLGPFCDAVGGSCF